MQLGHFCSPLNLLEDFDPFPAPLHVKWRFFILSHGIVWPY
ncbi:hypothetical protein VRK_23460 [Vibrio sp. MEBiC08052]|nr:hypothetical protein VRK_23460 [Vibrio sp. MEBiC08052]